MTEAITPAEAVSLAAEQAARIVNLATEEAKKIINAANDTTTVAASREQVHDEKMTRIVSEALREVFGENQEAQRFIDVKRIPLICKSILDIHENIKDIKSNLEKTDGDHEGRIRGIEKNMWKWIGVLLIIPPVLTIAIAWFLSVVIKH